MTAIDAIFTGGKFQPLGSVNLAENQHVRLIFEPSPTANDEAEYYRRLESVQSLAEMMELRKLLPTDGCAMKRFPAT